MFGHLLGASGAMSAVSSVLTITRGVIGPTINLEHPDPECDLDYIPNAPRDERSRGVEVCLSNSFGFGGQNDTLVVRRFRE
jgi:3-oxoacyl-[acyl-carrier-protein] synthase II